VTTRDRTAAEVRRLLAPERHPVPSQEDTAMPTVPADLDAIVDHQDQHEPIVITREQLLPPDVERQMAERAETRGTLTDRDVERRIADAAMQEDTARILQLLDRPAADVLAVDQRARLVILGEVLDRAPGAALSEVLALARWVELGEMATVGEGR
jgi:hypothetical protein